MAAAGAGPARVREDGSRRAAGMSAEAPRLTVGEFARRTGTDPSTARWYEGAGVLPRPERSGGGHRRYGPAHLARLDFVRRAREPGFRLDAVRDPLDLAGRDRAEIRATAGALLAGVERRLRLLGALRDGLRRVGDARAGGASAGCGFLQVLADDGHGRRLPDDRARGGEAPIPPGRTRVRTPAEAGCRSPRGSLKPRRSAAPPGPTRLTAHAARPDARPPRGHSGGRRKVFV